ncbi:hypothetical protein IWQ61_006715 [Dispira simplex]|nr:hypothetical protein IWQ61_006715 [Dispira simplex]
MNFLPRSLFVSLGSGVVTTHWPQVIRLHRPAALLSAFHTTPRSAQQKINSLPSNTKTPTPLFSVVPNPGGEEGFWLDLESHGVRRPSSLYQGDSPLMYKRMGDSYCEFVLPFRDHPELLDNYINVHGTIRVGRILEELDKLAGAVAYRHCADSNNCTPPLTIVTASVDRIELRGDIGSDKNYKFSGKVCQVGTSSMEIYLKMESLKDNSHTQAQDVILVAHFTMVARDRETQKAVKVNPLFMQTPCERKIADIASNIRTQRIERRQQSLTRVPPSANERQLMHQLYLESLQYIDRRFDKQHKPDHIVWADEAILESVTLTMPQDRNVHHKIFGGYLMRLALELAYAQASLFAKRSPKILAIDDITFKKPVPIGSVLYLTSQVTYSSGLPNASYEISVRADVIHPSAGIRETTNVFHLTFKGPEGAQAPRVLPRTYADLMRYIDANRRYELHKDEFTLPQVFVEDL